MADSLHAGNSQNEATSKQVRTRSSFDLSYNFFDTHRFGEYHPHFVMDTVADDKNISLRSAHNVRSYTLGAPLMQDIQMKKDYFMVPREALLPLNWEKFFTNPTVGQDVPDNVGTCMIDGVACIMSAIKKLRNEIVSVGSGMYSDTSVTDSTYVTAVFRFLILAESVLSDGSLLSSLGCHLGQYVGLLNGLPSYTDPDGNTVDANLSPTFDDWFDRIVSDFVKSKNSSGVHTFDGAEVHFSDGSWVQISHSGSINGPESKYVSFRHALDLMREHPLFDITNVNTRGVDIAGSAYSISFEPASGSVTWEVPLDLSRLFAYQIVCAHFYSNDKIDAVYSADMYRSTLGAFYRQWSNSVPYFSINGVTYYYDWMSGKVSRDFIEYVGQSASSVLKYSVATSLGTSVGLHNLAALGWWSYVFMYRRSLRYMDYFTGSRSHPLAIGNVNVSVSSNLVNIVDVTANIQKQRFLNAVNRSGRRFGNYLREIFGSSPAPDYHNPFFIGHTMDTVFGSEVENTASEQWTQNNSVTSVLRSNGARFAFEFDSDRPSILIGITYYDLPRVYSRSIERPFFHVNRFDMFNPYFQFVGDQPVYEQELGNQQPGYLINLPTFGYQLRHAEYKQRYNQCAGGFCRHLPGYIFVANDEGNRGNVISEDFIRSLPSELDKFYLSLTGYSLGTYFHFIVENVNSCSASRPMAYAPSIL